MAQAAECAGHVGRRDFLFSFLNCIIQIVFEREFEHWLRICKLCAVQYWLIYYIVSISTDGLSGRGKDRKTLLPLRNSIITVECY